MFLRFLGEGGVCVGSTNMVLSESGTGQLRGTHFVGFRFVASE